MPKLAGAGTLLGVAVRKKREPGKYAKPGALLLKAIEDLKLSRKEFADAIKVEGGERTVGHWVLGATWPRDLETRLRIRNLVRDTVMDELESEWAKVLGLPHVSAPERRLLEIYRTKEGMEAINKAVEKLAKGRSDGPRLLP